MGKFAPMRIVRHIPNAVTCLNLLSGALGIALLAQGKMEAAFTCMVCASAFDFGDGLAARLLGAYSEKGKELDSLSDMVSFCVLPAQMLVSLAQHLAPWGEDTPLRLLAYVPLLFAAAGGLRLAKFNLDTRQTENFLGLPTPAAAMVCGALCCQASLTPGSALARLCGTAWFLPALALGLSALLVSELPFFGMKIQRGKHLLAQVRRIVFFVLCAGAALYALLGHKHWSLAVLATFAAYIVENLTLLPFTGGRKAS